MVNMEREYKYTAFISYNSKDNYKARWLQKRLETYNLPSVIANDKGEVLRSYNKEPKKFRIFRYVTDLVAQNLDDGLRQELDQSKFLIVICSPNSANATWVRKEVKHFIDTGRKKQIIPFVIKGLPYSGGEEECFMPELKEAFPGGSALGVSLNDYGDDLWIFRERKAVAKMVSLLIDLPNAYDFIWNRYRSQYIRNIINKSVLIIGVLLAIYFTYTLDKVFTCSIKVIECSMPNHNLPIAKDALITLELGDDIKNIAVKPNETITINNIPQKFYGKRTRVHFEGFGYHSLDTIVDVKHCVYLNIYRDEEIYGNIQFVLKDISTENPLPYEEIIINKTKTKSDKNGMINISIPFSEQNRYYKLSSDKLLFVEDSIEPPFTESSIVEVIKK